MKKVTIFALGAVTALVVREIVKLPAVKRMFVAGKDKLTEEITKVSEKIESKLETAETKETTNE